MTRANKNLLGLTETFEGLSIHKNHLNGLAPDEFASGLNSLAATLKALYTGIANDPQSYAMKDADDLKGHVKNINFLLLLAQKGIIKGDSLEIEGKTFAAALKDAKVTKPERYFQIYEPLGFSFSGLGKKIEASEKIITEFPDNKHLLNALKSMADAVGAFSAINPNQGNIYFELLDPRVLENHPATEPKPTMEYIIPKLNINSGDVIKRFYEYIKPFAKCEIKGSLEWYWTVTFILKSTKKVILSFKLDQESHKIKLNLANIGSYVEHVKELPAKMIDEIKNSGWGCNKENCNPKCAGGFKFDLNGVSYNKCRGGAFTFNNPDKNESELLLGLLKKEIEFS